MADREGIDMTNNTELEERYRAAMERQLARIISDLPSNAREALYQLWSAYGSSVESDSSDGYELADAILAAGFRRPASITDAQVEAAWEALNDIHGTGREAMRAALEAARDAS